jgi:hypothetical protein
VQEENRLHTGLGAATALGGTEEAWQAQTQQAEAADL